VTLAVVNLATIDLAVRYADIYSGSLSGVELDDLINTIVVELISIVDRLESAGDVRIVLGNCVDFGVTFSVRNQAAFSDPVGRALLTQAALTLNTRIDDFADANGYPVLDIFNWANLGFNGMTIDGILIDGSSYQNGVPNPDDFFEDTQHPGSVAHGLLANAFLGVVRDAWGEYTAPHRSVIRNSCWQPGCLHRAVEQLTFRLITSITSTTHRMLMPVDHIVSESMVLSGCPPAEATTSRMNHRSWATNGIWTTMVSSTSQGKEFSLWPTSLGRRRLSESV